MSTMAGFDLVVEVSTNTALRLIQANLQLADTPLNPPFELEIPVAIGTDSYAAVIVTRMSLALVGDQGANLTLHFENSSIIVTAPAVTITLLDGDVTIGTTLQLVDAGGVQKALAADLASASVNVAFSPTAMARITAGLIGLPITAAQVTSLAQTALLDFIHAAGQQTIKSPTFTVRPGMTGSISQGYFERLLVHNIGDQAIGLFGMLIPGKPMGDPNQKTGSEIPAWHDIAVEIGPDAFHQLIFCPNLAGGGSVPDLPPSCGGGSIDLNGATFTNITDSFGNGRIDISGNFQKSGTCYDAYGTFHAAVTLSMSGPAINANVAVDDPSIDVHVPWYCTLGEILLGPFGLLVNDAIRSSATSSAGDLQKGLSALAGGGGLAFGSGNLANASFDNARITPEAIVVTGTVEVDLPVAATPGVKILGSVTVSRDMIMESRGIYVVPDGCMQGSYPYIHFEMSGTGTFLAVPTLLGRPLTLEWHLECWEGYWGYNSSPKLISAALLGGTSGTVVLDGVTTRFAMPLPGGSSIVQPVHVDYKASSDAITLHNWRGEGNYGFILSLKATDPAGHMATTHTGVDFEGDSVVILGGYQEKLAACIASWRSRVSRIKTDPGIIPPWVPVNYPNPGDLVQFIRFVAAQGTEDSDQLTLQVILAHGSSYFRALQSREAVDAPSLAAPQGASAKAK